MAVKFGSIQGGSGCNCCGPQTRFCLAGCVTPGPGFGITVVSGSTTVAAGTTDATGCVTLPVPTGTYRVLVTNPGGTSTGANLFPINVTGGTTVTLTLSGCVKLTIIACNSVPAACPVTVAVACAGSTVFSGQTDATGSVSFLQASIGGCTAYVSGPPPGFTVNPAGYPLTSNPQTIYLVPAAAAECCPSGMMPVPDVFTLTDALGSVTMTYNTTSHIWNGCIPTIPASVPVCNSGYPATTSVAYQAQCSTTTSGGATVPALVVMRTWPSILSPRGYAQAQNCVTPCPGGWTGGGGGGVGDYAEGYLILADCRAFGGPVSLTPLGSNWMPDPVGGGVVVS